MAASVENFEHVFYSQILPLVVTSQAGDLQEQESLMKRMMLVSTRSKTWVTGSTPWIRHLLRVLDRIVTDAQQDLDVAIAQNNRQIQLDVVPAKKRPYIVTIDDLIEDSKCALDLQVVKRPRIVL